MIIMKKGRFRFLPCPICGTQTNTKVLPETILIRYPLFCEKCRQEILVDVVKMKMVLSDAEDEPAGDEEAQKE
jgi:ssDNA-binding Zn-finger/Zn-ribbon topoisomerase 1